jgi:uncharacterized protein (DUF1800 family)
LKLGVTAAAAALAACTVAPVRPQRPYIEAKTDEDAARFLLQAQFSASDAEIARVRSVGCGRWLTEQFAARPSETGWDWLNRRGYDAIHNDTRYYDNSYPGDHMIWHQLMTSPDAVRKRCALALSEFFVVSLTGLDFGWRSHGLAHYWDQLSANAFGNFRTLLEDITLNPAMGFYLNTKGNQKENPATGRVPDENYAREVMQLFTIGLYQLNPDGSDKLDAAGHRMETYTQSDVSNLARVFTGYDFDQSRNVVTVEPVQQRKVGSTAFTRMRMALAPARHSSLEAVFLGTRIAANTPGDKALKTALDALFAHPNVGPFFCRQMIQRLVTSNPSPAYVARVSAAFNDDGHGVRGNLQAVWEAILLDDEARSHKGLTDPRFGRLREPMLRFIQWGRTFGIRSAEGSWKLGDLTNPATQLGQSPLRSPSVFNFFRPGYVPPATMMATSGSLAPEFQIVTESSVSGYLNYMQNVIRNGIFVNTPNLPNNVRNAKGVLDISATYKDELAIVTNASALVKRLNLLLCAGQLSAATQALMINGLNATPVSATSSDAVKLNRVASAIFMVMAAPEYLVQK